MLSRHRPRHAGTACSAARPMRRQRDSGTNTGMGIFRSGDRAKTNQSPTLVELPVGYDRTTASMVVARCEAEQIPIKLLTMDESGQLPGRSRPESRWSTAHRRGSRQALAASYSNLQRALDQRLQVLGEDSQAFVRRQKMHPSLVPALRGGSAPTGHRRPSELAHRAGRDCRAAPQRCPRTRRTRLTRTDRALRSHWRVGGSVAGSGNRARSWRTRLQPADRTMQDHIRQSHSIERRPRGDRCRRRRRLPTEPQAHPLHGGRSPRQTS